MRKNPENETDDKMIATIESVYDSFLNVSTQIEEGDEKVVRGIYNAYEATSYFFLERLFQVFPFAENDHMIDFGCGKGRVLFMASQYACKHITGYEINEKRFSILEQNIRQYREKHKTASVFDVYNESAQSAAIDDSANKFFFFEPFHLSIYAKVLKNIKDSLKRRQRDISIILYLPQDSTMNYIDTIPGFHKEIYVDTKLYYQKNMLLTMPYYAFYCNYSMEDIVDPFFLLY